MATCCGIFDAVIFFLGFCVRESVTVVSQTLIKATTYLGARVERKEFLRGITLSSNAE